MTNYLVLYHSPGTVHDQMANGTPDQAKAGMDAWMAWAGKAGGAVVDLGFPLGDSKRIDSGSASDGSATARGYSILRVDSLDAAAKLLEDHPHVRVPGNSIDVFETLEMPGM